MNITHFWEGTLDTGLCRSILLDILLLFRRNIFIFSDEGIYFNINTNFNVLKNCWVDNGFKICNSKIKNAGILLNTVI